MSGVFVVDAEKRPQDPLHPGTARWLLGHGKAAVWRRYPFAIILKCAVPDTNPEPLRVKIDPGSRTTGLALVNDRTGQVTWSAELTHRGQRIHERLLARKAIRGGRRSRHTRSGLPKAHWIDAACVGANTPEQIQATGVVPLLITAMGREWRQMCCIDRFGFPRTSAKGARRVQGFKTGDLVRAVVPAPSIKAGTYVGRLAVRASGSCDIRTSAGTVQSIHLRYFRPLQRGDGYAYQNGAAALPPQA